MTAQPERVRAPGAEDADRPCPECGRPIERDGDGKPFPVCRSCYDLYVDNAGR